MTYRTSLMLCVAVGLALLAAPSVQASTLTWDNGDGNGLWDTTSQNWSGTATWNNGTPDEAVFGATGVGTVTLDEDITAAAVTFDTAGYTIAGGGNTLTMNGDITANESATISAPLSLTATQTWEVANGKTLSVSDVVIGADDVDLHINNTGGDGSTNIVNMTGALSLINAKFTVNGGRFDYSGAGGTVTSDNAFVVGDGYNGTMNVTGGSLAVDASNKPIVIGVKSVADTGASGTIHVSGGTLTLETDGGDRGMELGGDKSWGNIPTNDPGEGTLTVSGTGLVQINGNTDISFGYQGGTGTVNLDGGTLETARPFIERADGTGTINFNGGTLKATGDNGNWIQGLTCNVKAGGAVIDTNGYNVTIAEALLDPGGGGGLTKDGAGTLVLSGACTYSGDTTVSGGTLTVTSAFLDDASTLEILSGASLTLDHTATDTINLFILDGVTQEAGTYDASNTPTYLSGNGSLHVLTPEPATLALLSLGGVATLLGRKRRR